VYNSLTVKLSSDLETFFTARDGEALPKYARLYFDLLWSDFLTVLPACDADQDDSVLTALAKTKAAGPTWGSLYALQNLILTCLSVEDIRRFAWLVRMRYKDIAGSEDYAAYILSKPPSEMDAAVDDKLLKADVRILLREILWLYAITPERERARLQVGRPMLLLTGALVIGVVTTYFVLRWWWPGAPHEMPLLVVVMALGALGGFISAQRRLFSVPAGGDRINQLIQLDANTLEYVLPPISGAVFATIALLLFLSGLLQGDLFPKMDTPERSSVAEYLKPSLKTSDSKTQDALHSNGVNVLYFASMSEPLSGKDYGKLMVWCFVAGFAETFVPGVLNRLTSKAEDPKQ
jgi:hypothetical protein